MTSGLRRRDWLPEFVLLGMIWGSSFFFTLMATQEFGPWSTAWMRVSVAAITLLPLVFWQHQAQTIKAEWRALFGMGLFNSAVPFFCFAFALQSLSTGLSSILNATTPLFGALIAWLWLKDRPTHWRGLGLLLGFAGSAWLAVHAPGGVSFKTDGSGWAILACLLATCCYSFSSLYSQRHLQHVSPMVIATGSQLGAFVVLAVPGYWYWPSVLPSMNAWLSLLAVGMMSTGLAYVLYFRLIVKTGAARTMTLTYLIPLFANLIGVFVLDEIVTGSMLMAGGVILLGTAMASGLFPRQAVSAPP